LFFDLLIPTVFIILLLNVSYWISKTKKSILFDLFGKQSLTIMYLHIPINLVAQKFLGVYGILTFTLIGALGSLVISYILGKFAITRYLFLGTQFKQKMNKKINISQSA
jgi:hypothetical protein